MTAMIGLVIPLRFPVREGAQYSILLSRNIVGPGAIQIVENFPVFWAQLSTFRTGQSRTTHKPIIVCIWKHSPQLLPSVLQDPSFSVVDSRHLTQSVPLYS